MGDDGSNQVKKLISELQNEELRLFSHSEIIDITSNLSNIIGTGGFGDIYKGELPDGMNVAVKVLKDNHKEKKFMDKQFMAELGTMGRTYHQNLVKLYGFCFEDNMKALVYEYMENGSLDKILYSKDSDIEWVKLYEIAVDTAKGLSYLHETCHPQIVHHDIKADNVLLDSNLCPKITDFGLSRRDLSHVSPIGFRGTRGYAAPELCFGWNDMTSYKCDVFSFGMLLFEVLKRRRVWEDGEQEWFPVQVWKNLKNGGQLIEIMTKCGIGEKDKGKANRLSLVALLCAQHSPEERPLMSNVVKMLEGEMEAWLPLEPFPYYEFSSSESSCYSFRSSSHVSAAFDEKRPADNKAEVRENRFSEIDEAVKKEFEGRGWQEDMRLEADDIAKDMERMVFKQLVEEACFTLVGSGPLTVKNHS